ncbi:MAG: TVP38/TMEM64 family protein [Candidatus Binataceae bacterium]
MMMEPGPAHRGYPIMDFRRWEADSHFMRADAHNALGHHIESIAGSFFSRFDPRFILKLTLAMVVIAAIIIVARHLGAEARVRQLLETVRNLGALAPLAFVGIYILSCVLFLPGVILTVGAGALFGLGLGSIYASIGATLGATAAFLAGRYLARELVAARLDNYPRFKLIDTAVARDGRKIVFLTRLTPVLPFNFLNYAYGLTGVRLGDYVLASWLGMLPGTVMYVYIGSLAGSLARAGGHSAAKDRAEWMLYAVGFAATVAVALYIARIARQSLGKTA